MEQDREEILRQGQLAQDVLNNEAFISAFEELDNELRDAMFLTAPDAKEKRDELYYMVINLSAVKDKLITKLNNAQFEKEQEQE